jgi:hypothetical protein
MTAMAIATRVEVPADVDVTRALVSDQDPFQPDGCCESWRSLLQWALGGPAPFMFQGLRVEAPRMCARDQRVLMARVGWECGG